MLDGPASIQTDQSATPDPGASDELVRRLEARLRRERASRREAEEIADRGMRDLWIVNRDLDRLVEERTADLADSLRRFEQAALTRDRFLSSLSHEMRTPLNGILGMLELLERHVPDRQGADYLTTATASADRLHQLLSRLLDLIDLDSGRLVGHPRPTDWHDLVDRVRQRWQATAMATGHLLSLIDNGVGSDRIAVDGDRVLQMADELIGNAVTHGLPGLVEVEFGLHVNRLHLTVTDAGPGLTESQIEQVLNDQPLPSENHAEAGRGLGLGLGLVRKMAEALGGSLELVADGGRSSACLQVPIEAADDDHEPAWPGRAAPHRHTQGPPR